MIFEREVYRKINIIRAVFKKYALFNLSQPKKFHLVVDSLYPATIKEIENTSIELLNQNCHSDAFLLKNKKVFIELSKCNSCMECRGNDGIIFSKIDQINKIIDEKYLPLDR